MEIKRFVLSEFGVNSYLVMNNNEAILIDVGFEPKKIVKYIQEKGLNLLAILLTHAHLDHIGGIKYVKEHYDVPIYQHYSEEDWLSDPELNGSKSYPYFGLIQLSKAEELIKQEGVLSIGSFLIEVIHTPGHTPGGLSFYMKPWVFTGDTLFQQSIGRTDLYGGDQEELILSITHKLFHLPDETIVYPGHEEKTTVGDEKKFNPFVGY